MDCSLRRASRKEQSIAPKHAFFGPIRTRKRAGILHMRVLLVFQKRLDFKQAKQCFFWCFMRPCISGSFCLFIPCNLSRLSLGRCSGTNTDQRSPTSGTRTRKVYSVFSTVFLLLLLLAVAVGCPAACFGR